MAVGSVTATSSAATNLTSVANSTLDKDAFLKLLVTQLQYQDPMNPMDDTQFISQLAQFSSLEQMQSLNSGFETLSQSGVATQAFSMIGKLVDYADPATGYTYSGTVDSVSFEDGQPKLKIGSSSVDLQYVTHVYPDTASFGKGKMSEQAFALIGKTVDYVDSSGTAKTGKVDNVTFANGWPMLNVGSDSVDARDVTSHTTISSTGSDDLDKAIAMAGRRVAYTDATGQVVQGVVDNVTADNGTPRLVIGTTLVDPSSVVTVY